VPGGSVIFRDFSPGLVTALLLYVPVNALIMRSALCEGLVSSKTLWMLFFAGGVLFWGFEIFGPLVLLVGVMVAWAWVLASYRKFTGHPVPVATFKALGVGQWFRFVTGALEFAGAVGLLIPATHLWAAAGLAVVMVGAALTHLVFIGGSATLAFILLAVLAVVIVIGRRR